MDSLIPYFVFVDLGKIILNDPEILGDNFVSNSIDKLKNFDKKYKVITESNFKQLSISLVISKYIYKFSNKIRK